jgi:hypothetical protein
MIVLRGSWVQLTLWNVVSKQIRLAILYMVRIKVSLNVLGGKTFLSMTAEAAGAEVPAHTQTLKLPQRKPAFKLSMAATLMT